MVNRMEYRRMEESTTLLWHKIMRGRTGAWVATGGLLLALAQPVWAAGGPPANAPEVFMDGEVTLIHIDEIVQEKSRMAYFLQEKGSDKVVEMFFEGEPPGNFKTGAKVKVKGRHANNTLWVTEVAAVDGGTSSATGTETVAPATTGDRKTVTLLINMQGVDYAAQGATPYTTTHVDQAGRAMHDQTQFSVNTAYEEASFGQVTFSGSASTDVFIVSIPYDAKEACAYRTISSQADAASPVNLNGYIHRMYVVPPAAISGCTWLALGEVGSYGSTSVRRAWSTRIDAIAFAHELGHNIGWHHAATDPDNDGTLNVEYGDTSDLMGYCCSQRKLSSVHVDQVGWFDRADLRARMVDVTGAGSFRLAPLGTDPAASSDPQILRITPATGWPYYLSYRQRTGRDAGMSATYTTGVNVHRGLEAGNWSYLIKVLKSDFSDPNLNQFHDAGNGITISQVENNASYVTIDVSFDSCVVQAPQVAMTPVNQSVGDVSQVQPYLVTVTNRDTLGCDAATLSVVPTFPSGVMGSVQQAALTVAPGSSASTTMTVSSINSSGSYSLKVNISDSHPKHAGQATASLTVDVTAPSAPTGVTATLSGSKRNKSVQLGWTQATDVGSGIASYSVYRDGVLLGSTTSLGFTDRSFSTTVTNNYEVYAVDKVGHVSATPGTVSYTYSGGSTTGGGGGGKGKGAKSR